MDRLSYEELVRGRTYRIHLNGDTHYTAIVTAEMPEGPGQRMFGIVVYADDPPWSVGTPIWLGTLDIFEELTDEEATAYRLSN